MRAIEFARVFGAVIFAFICTGLNLWLLYQANLFRSVPDFEEHLVSLIMTVGGFVATIAPDEVASWTGRYGWTRATYRVLPEHIVKAIGIASIIVVTWQLMTV